MSSKTYNEGDDQTGDEEWEVIGDNEANDDEHPSSHDHTRRGHFELNLGWGRWKHTLFWMDWSYTRKCARKPVRDDTELPTEKRG